MVFLEKKIKKRFKLVYKYVKSQQKIDETVRALFDKDDHIVTDRKLVTEILNEQYKSVFNITL